MFERPLFGRSRRDAGQSIVNHGQFQHHRLGLAEGVGCDRDPICLCTVDFQHGNHADPQQRRYLAVDAGVVGEVSADRSL